MPIKQDAEKCINSNSEQYGSDFHPCRRQAALFCFIFRLPVCAEASLIIGLGSVFVPSECHKARDAANREGGCKQQHHYSIEELAPSGVTQGMSKQVPKKHRSFDIACPPRNSPAEVVVCERMVFHPLAFLACREINAAVFFAVTGRPLSLTPFVY
jgi:hypothetical protein